MQQLIASLERHQIALCLAALAAGAALGLGVPVAHALAPAVNPVLALLIAVTFLGVPFAQIGQGLRDRRFVTAALVVNFVVAPVIALALVRLAGLETAVALGLLIVLLCPCVDYVMVFTGAAGGAQGRLVAVAPLLMLAQLLLLPVYLRLFAALGGTLGAAGGAGPALGAIPAAPFVEALVWLVLVPLAAAAGLQWLARRSRFARRAHDGALGAMVPLMMLTLALVAAAQIGAVGASAARLWPVVPVCVAFAALMLAAGMLTGRIAGLDVAGRRAIAFTGVTRNSLVVLPLALALPEPYALAPLSVVTQTLVELVIMVVMIRLVPKLIPAG